MNEKLFNAIDNFNINDINEKFLIGRILDRYRWPSQYINSWTSLWSRDCPSVEVLLNNTTQSGNFYLNDDYLNSKKVLEYYDLGHTVILSRVDYFSEDTTKITELLNDHYGEVTANIYWSKGSSSVSFPLHDHNYHVLVKNICGKSVWTIADQEILLENQQALYFDAHTQHCVKEILEPKISITFNIPK
jgi:hypothetical protein